MKQVSDIPWYICDIDKKNYITYSDTDSIYINAIEIAKKRDKDWNNKSDEEKDNIIEKIALEFESKINNHYNKLSKELFNIQGKHFLEMKTECVIRKGLFSNKRIMTLI